MAKLKTLHLENVGVHKDLTINFGKDFTTISGANKQGKTTIERSILDAIESVKDNLIKIGADEGKIELELDDGTKILQPLRPDGKPTVRLFQNNMEVKKPRTQLSEMSTAKIRAIDFFKGDGVKLEKEQVETLLSIIDLDLDKKEIKKICGELPLEDSFKALHPLDYIKALVNEKDGHYYVERAYNNKNIQTIEHSIDSLRQEVLDVFNDVNVNFDTFKESEYDYDLTNEMAKVTTLQRLHLAFDTNQEFLDSFDTELSDKEKAAKSYLDSKREELKSEYMKSLDDKKKDLYYQVYENAQHHLKTAYEDSSSFDIPAFIIKLNTIGVKTESYYKEKVKSIDETEKDIDSNIETQIKAYKTNLDEKIDVFKQKKVEAEKFIKDNTDLEPVKDLQDKIDKVYKIQKILPTYRTFVKNKSEFEDKKIHSDTLTNIIDELRKLPKILLQRSEMPVKNLTITDKGKFAYENSNGDCVPLSQLSGFEQIALSLDVSIAKLGHIRTLIIPQWSEVDDTNKEQIINHLMKNKVQGVAVKVGEGDLKIVAI